MEKNSAFECGFSSFLGQNRTQFSISFFIFALLFLLFDLEILLVYPYLVSAYLNEVYGLLVLMIFLGALTVGFVFELGKKALTIDSRQTSHSSKKKTPSSRLETHNNTIFTATSTLSSTHKTLLPKALLSNNQKRLFSSTNCMKGLGVQGVIDKTISRHRSFVLDNQRYKMSKSFRTDYLNAKSHYDERCWKTGHRSWKTGNIKRELSELTSEQRAELKYFEDAMKFYEKKRNESTDKTDETCEALYILRRNLLPNNNLPSIRKPESVTGRFMGKPDQWRPNRLFQGKRHLENEENIKPKHLGYTELTGKKIQCPKESLNPELELRTAYFDWTQSEKGDHMVKPYIPNTDIRGNIIDKPLEPVEISSNRFVDQENIENFLGKKLESSPRLPDIKWTESGHPFASTELMDTTSTMNCLLFISLGELSPWVRFAFIVRAMFKACSQVSSFFFIYVPVKISAFTVMKFTKCRDSMEYCNSFSSTRPHTDLYAEIDVSSHIDKATYENTGKYIWQLYIIAEISKILVLDRPVGIYKYRKYIIKF